MQGEFATERRYSDFEALREAWKKRIPGLYYPFLPPKKIFGNTDKSHLEERCFLLEQFLRKVYKIPYLIQSEEFNKFARHQVQGENSVKKALESLAPQSVNMLSARIKVANPDHQQPDPETLKLFWSQVTKTKEFAKQHLERMLEIKDMMKKYVSQREEYIVENTHYVVEQLSQFETTNL